MNEFTDTVNGRPDNTGTLHEEDNMKDIATMDTGELIQESAQATGDRLEALRNERIMRMVVADIDPMTALRAVDATDAIAAARRRVSRRRQEDK